MPGHRRYPLHLGIAPASGSRPERMLVDSPAYFGGRHRYGLHWSPASGAEGDSSLWRMAGGGYQYQPLEKWMDNVVYFTADLAVTGDHTLWYLASDTPSMIMNNVACAVNGEQGILALDWMAGFGCIPRRATTLPMRYICAMIFGSRVLVFTAAIPQYGLRKLLKYLKPNKNEIAEWRGDRLYETKCSLCNPIFACIILMFCLRARSSQ